MTAAVLTLAYVAYAPRLQHSCHHTALRPQQNFLQHSRQHTTVQPRQQFAQRHTSVRLQQRNFEPWSDDRRWNDGLSARALRDRLVQEAPLPRQLDIALAAAGAGSACALLCALEPYAGVPLWAPPLAASACILFASTDGPPDPLAVLGGTAAVATAAVALVGLFGPESEAARAFVVVAALAYFKESSYFFPPAAALGALLVDSDELLVQGWSYILFPCVAGNAVLWCLAALLAIPRTELRASLMTRQWQAGFRDTGQEREYFLEAFDARWDRGADSLSDALCDISGVCDLSDEEREIMLRAASSGDGRSRLDFSEFSESAYTQLFSSTQTRNKRRLRLRTLRSLWRRDSD